MNKIRDIVNALWPKVEGTEEIINKIKREAAVEAINYLRENYGFSEEHKQRERELEAKIKKLTDEAKVNEGVRSHLAAELDKAKKELASVTTEDIERIISNRVAKALAEQKAAAESSKWDAARTEDYRRLVMAERAAVTRDIKGIENMAHILHRDVVIRFCKSNAMVIAYQADGKRAVFRWRDLYLYCHQDGAYDPSPYTHYCPVPNITLEQLININPQTPTNENKTDIQGQ